MRSAHPDRLRELLLLLRSPERGATNLGEFLAAHADELSSPLGTTPDDLRRGSQTDDAELYPRLAERAKRAAERRRGTKRLLLSERARAAADRLALTARWMGRAVVLDSDLVLGDLVVDVTIRHVGFALEHVGTVFVLRDLLHRARLLHRLFMDVASFVDAAGVHLRWRGGVGRIDFKRAELEALDARDALVVSIPSSCGSFRPSSVVAAAI
jgi:hypothetical protein